MLESCLPSRHEHFLRVCHARTATLNKFIGSKSSLGTSVGTRLLIVFNGEKQIGSLLEMDLIQC